MIILTNTNVTLISLQASYETVMAKIESSKRVSSVVQLEDSQRRLQEKTLSSVSVLAHFNVVLFVIV